VRGVFTEPTAAGSIYAGGVPAAFLLARGLDGRIWLAGEQSRGGYLDRITSAGRQDPGFRSGHAFYTGDTADGHHTNAVLGTSDGGAILADEQCCDDMPPGPWSGGYSVFHANGLRAGGTALPSPPWPPNADAFGPFYVRGIARTANGGVREAAYVDADPGVVSLTGTNGTGNPTPRSGRTGPGSSPGSSASR
jgi:hypothetical protein